jgi:GT2 family glycosyltransferase
MASGEVLALTDDDVLVEENWVAKVREIFSDGSIALVGGRVDPLWERRAPWWLQVGSADQGSYGVMCSPLALVHYGEAQELGERTAVGANLAVRRTAFDGLGGLRPDLGRRRGTLLCGEDHDLCQRAVSAGLRCEYRPELQVRHWVPAVRTRLRYFVRWFYWSGVTQARLETPTGAANRRPPSAHRYYAGQLIAFSLRAAGSLVIGRPRAAVEQLMNAAFAVGYLAEGTKILRRGRSGVARNDDRNASRERAGVHG